MVKDQIPILLVENEALVRAGLKALIELDPALRVVGEAGNGRSAIELVLRLRPSVVVMDRFLPLLNGIEATRQLQILSPETKILILSSELDESCALEAARRGAAGFILKIDDASCLLRAIHQVHAGEAALSPIVAGRIEAKRMKRRFAKPTSTPPPGLSRREAEVLQLVAEGKSNKQTAAELAISPKTVEKHRQSLMEKLNIHDTAGLTRYAISSGAIRLSTSLSAA